VAAKGGNQKLTNQEQILPVPKQEAHVGNEQTLLLDIDGFKGFDNFIERLWTHGTKNFDFLFSWKAKTNAIGETVKVSEEKFSQEDSDKLTQAIRLGE
jgi:hypothetical protein